MRVTVTLRTIFVALGSILLLPGMIWAQPHQGSPAPALTGLKLLQAPASVKADWASLRGKVVVLEFWATWCSPCVASLPHLNHLVESLNPDRFQFISIDDEETSAVQDFLAKKKMAGWVGLDASGEVFRRYAVEARPTTIIVDGDGHIVAVTDIDSVSVDDLRAVGAGKPIAFKAAMEFTEVGAAGHVSGDEVGPPLFSVSVTKAAADARMKRANHPPTGTDMLGEDADSLFTDVFNIFGDRYVLKGALPDGRFDVLINTGDAPQSAVNKILQQTVLAALHLQIQPRTVTGPAYILRATDASRTLLSPSASTHAAKRGYWHDGFLLMNGTMDDLAYVLATGLKNPVINETGISGTFDARFKAPGDVASLNAVLKKTMGLELVLGGKDMSITVQEVSKTSSAKARQ